MKPHQIKTLRTKLLGSITEAKDVRHYFATDGGIFTHLPSAVMYPRNSGDVQAAVSYTYDQAKTGKGYNLVARGNGTNYTGATITSGATIVFPAYMNRVLRLTKDSVTVQPGATLQAVQAVLHTHGRMLPLYGTEQVFSTIGGAVATNSANAKSLKYGSAADWVKRLKVVLDDGSMIETHRMSHREIQRKKGIMNREGSLYRELDGLLQDHSRVIKDAQLSVARNTAGYQLRNVRGHGGSLDLSQLFIGSQGTLGLITEITLSTVRYEPRTNLVIGYFDTVDAAHEAMSRVHRLGPSRIEFIDRQLLEIVSAHHPEYSKGIVPEEIPQLLVMAEFDNPSHLRQNMLGRRAERIMKRYGRDCRTTANRKEQTRYWAMQQTAMVTLSARQAPKRPLPIIKDVCVPLSNLPEFMSAVHKFLEKHHLTAAIWGHGGDAVIHVMPYLNLAKAKDRKSVFKLIDEFYGITIKMGGTIAGVGGDGMLKGPYLERQYGTEMVEVMKQVKQICDPHGVFNTEIKVGATKKRQEELLRPEFGTGHPYDHLPHR